MKKLISMLLALVMCLSLCISTFATPSDEHEAATTSVPLGYERIMHALSDAGIAYSIADHQLKLVDASPDNAALTEDLILTVNADLTGGSIKSKVQENTMILPSWAL